MGTYKGSIHFPDRVAPLVRHMPAVDDHREALAALSGTWDTLALLAQLSNEETLIGVVVVPCGHAIGLPAAVAPQIANVPGGTGIATFLIGDPLLGVPARAVLECVAVTAPVRVWRGGLAQRPVLSPEATFGGPAG